MSGDLFSDLGGIVKNPTSHQKLTMAGTALNLAGTVSQSLASSSAASSNAELAAMRRGASVFATQQKIFDLKRARLKTLGSIRAKAGANGITMSGSALDVLEDSAYMAEIDIQRAAIAGFMEAEGFKREEELSRNSARTAIGQGIVSSGGIILSGARDLLKIKSVGQTSSGGKVEPASGSFSAFAGD